MNVIRPTRLVTPIMQAQKGGAIINISTAWAFEPSSMFPTSAVFRAGLASYTKIFANTYAADNVRMNNVLPGWIDSLPATEERRAERADGPLWHGVTRSRQRSPSSHRRALATSPGRTSASTAASRARSDDHDPLSRICRRPGHRSRRRTRIAYVTFVLLGLILGLNFIFVKWAPSQSRRRCRCWRQLSIRSPSPRVRRCFSRALLGC